MVCVEGFMRHIFINVHSFIHTITTPCCRNPNGDSGDLPVTWPALDDTTFPYAIFDTPDLLTVKYGLRYEECAFWNDLYAAFLNKASTKPKARAL